MTDSPIDLGQLSCPRCGKAMLDVSVEGSVLVFAFDRGGERHFVKHDLRPAIEVALAQVLNETLLGGIRPEGKLTMADERGSFAAVSLAETWAELEHDLTRISPEAATAGQISYWLACSWMLRVLSIYDLRNLGHPPGLPHPAELLAQWRHEIERGMPRQCEWPPDPSNV